MNWSDATHTFQATECRRTGAPCAEAARLVQQLAGSVALAMVEARPRA